MGDFDIEVAIIEIKQLFKRLVVGEIIELMDRSGVPDAPKVGNFRVDYLAKRLGKANVHQLASLSGVLKTRLGDRELLKSSVTPISYRVGQTFQIFVSHSNAQADAACDLRENLAFGGIDCFVARGDDQLEMDRLEAVVTNLDAADVLLSLVSDCAVKSAICNQEIGFALGREIPVISLGDDLVLPGLAKPLEVIDRCAFDTEKNVALKVIDSMLQYPQLGPKLTDTLVDTLVSCSSPSDSFKIIGFCRKALAFSSYMTAGQLYELRRAARENDQIARFASGRGPELIESMCIKFEERIALAG